MKSFLNSVSSEWLKTRKSAASWLMWCGAFFIPLIMVLMQVFYPHQLPVKELAPHYWETLFIQCWESMSVMLLPVGVILATSLITQLEYKNNTWKQVYATPQSMATIFLAKLAVIFIMLLQFFVLFLVGIVLAGFLPPLVRGTFEFPAEAFPVGILLKHLASFFVACLPLIALQFLISMRYRNFLVSVGIGLGLVIASIFAISWEHGYVFPYAYAAFHFFAMTGKGRTPDWVNIYWLSLLYFVFFTAVHYVLYITKREKG